MPTPARRAAAAAGRRAQDRERRRGRARRARRGSSSTRTSAGSRSGSASPARRTRSRSSATCMRLVPRAKWGRFPHLLIWHGRRVCDRAAAALRGLRPHRPLPVVARPGLARRERDEQPAVLVVGGEEVGGHRLLDARARPQTSAVSPEPADAPLVATVPGSRPARSPPGRTRPSRPCPISSRSSKPVSSKTPRPVASTRAFLVADDEPGRLRRVVVLEQLEEEAEAAVVAGRRPGS